MLALFRVETVGKVCDPQLCNKCHIRAKTPTYFTHKRTTPQK